MKAKAAQQFAEADESIDSEASPLAQRSARQFDRQRGAPQSHDLAAALREAADDATTDFGNLNLSDTSLLIDSATPDISQLMAQTPMKLNASGGWDRPQHVPLAVLAQRTREAGRKPAPPRTPPRRDEEDSSIEETPRAGYTFEAQDVGDDSLEQEEATAILDASQPEPEGDKSSPRQADVQDDENEAQIEATPSFSESPGRPDDSIRNDNPPSIYSQRMRSFNVSTIYVHWNGIEPA
jgi:hypothetical protein